MSRVLISLLNCIAVASGLLFALCYQTAYAQEQSNAVDLGIRPVFVPDSVKINGVFQVTAEVYLDANSSEVPSGEGVQAIIELKDPDGFTIDSMTESWDGFNTQTNGQINDLFQVTWSQATKWSPDRQWSIVMRITTTSSVESDQSNNLVTENFTLIFPDLTIQLEGVTSTNPITGEQTTNFISNTNYRATGQVTNIGNCMTQPGVYIQVIASLVKLNQVDIGLLQYGDVVDQQIILLPSTQEHAGLQAGESWTFEIDELFMPADAEGLYTVVARVNPFNDMKEVSTNNNSDLHPATTQDDDGDGVIDFITPPYIEIGANSEDQGLAELNFVANSYDGERGSFRGLEPIFLSFAVRNSGSGTVKSSDNITARILLSEDIQFDDSDFILREFNVGGSGIGLGMVAGETINLTWFQQLPDNFEGDYYILVQIINEQLPGGSESQESVSSMSNTPILTLTTEDRGETKMLKTISSIELSLMESLLGEASTITNEITSLYDEMAQSPSEIRPGYLQLIGEKEKQLREIAAQIAALKSPTERAAVSENGRYLAYEKRAPVENSDDLSNINGAFQQVFVIDTMQPNPEPQLISRTYLSSSVLGEPASGDSYRPQISDDGDTIVFHSRADDLVPGDTNDKEDVFLYRISTNTMLRAVNANNQELNGKSLYPDVNGDGTKVVFSSDSTNADLSTPTNGRQIFVWFLDGTGTGYIEVISVNASSEYGNGSSFNPSIDKLGNRLVFDSYASNLVNDDTNLLRDIFLAELNTSSLVRINLNYDHDQSQSGHSLNPRISGSGNRVVFESFSTNLVPQAGIAHVELPEGGAGYQGDPTVEVYDAGLNSDGRPGNGAILRIKEDGINALQELKTDAIEIIDSGEGYVQPIIRIVPDPAFPEPLYEANAVAYLSSPEGDVYFVDIPDDLVNADDDYNATRISQNLRGVGGNFGSRDLSISTDGNSIVYATKASNLLPDEIRREDGKKFYSDTFELPKAEAIIVGGIGEIEIKNTGTGYTGGMLQITDLSGSGSGALASYQVDNFGRIVTIEIIHSGDNYRLDTTLVRVESPLGGSGFEPGEIKFLSTLGEGKDRTGGGRIFKVEMVENGYGFRVGDDENSTFGEIFSFEGDGADLNEDGFPDGRLNPDLVHIIDERLYLEQRFEIEIINLEHLANTTLTISDKNTSLDPLEIEFGASSFGANTIITTNKSKFHIRDELIQLIDLHLGSTNSGGIQSGIVIDQNQTGGSKFRYNALSGKFSSSNSLGISVTPISNMLIKGSGYTRATPVLNQVPVVYGYSEISSSKIKLEEGSGRVTALSSPDTQTDDIYLYNVESGENDRISVSTFGTPIRYLNNLDSLSDVVPSLPSNRFPVISGNGRYVFFSSDSSGREGLAFDASNQYPLDNNPSRDLYYRDLKTFTLTEQTASVDLLFPNDNISHTFAPQSPIPVIAQVEYSGSIERVDMILNQRVIGQMEEFDVGKNLSTRRYFSQIREVNNEDLRGEYSLQLVAYSAGDLSVAASSLIRFTVDSFNGSIPPTVSMTAPDFQSITSKSTIPLSADGNDPDGMILGIQYYLEGNPYGDEILRTEGIAEEEQKYPMLLELNTTESNGVRSVFVIGRDNSGSYVASGIYNFTFTSGGNQKPQISLNNASSNLKLSEDLNNLDVNVSSEGEIIGLQMLLDSIGSRIMDARVDVSGVGSGAVINPIIDTNISSPNFGQIIELSLVSGGFGWEENTTTLSIVPIIRAINKGVHAEVEHFIAPPEDVNQTNLSGVVKLRQDVEGTPKVGSGYAISPRLQFTPNYKFEGVPEFLPLADPIGATSSVQVFDEYALNMDIDFPVTDAYLVGGFAQSPIYVSVEANSSGEKIKSVTLVINGEALEDNVKVDPPYSFAFSPNSGPGDYIVSAIVEDHAGNIISTPSSVYNVANFEGSGISLDFKGETEISIESDGILLLFAEATSAASKVREANVDDVSSGAAQNVGDQILTQGISEVEFFIDDHSVGLVDQNNSSSNFYISVDLSQLNLKQGEHEIAVIARDVLGNQIGTFKRSQTNIPSRQNKKLNILPPASRQSDSLYLELVYPTDFLTEEINATLYEGATYMAVVDLEDRFSRVSGLRMLANGVLVDELNLRDDNQTNPDENNVLTYDRKFLSWENITAGNYLISFEAIGNNGGIIPLPVLEANDTGDLIKPTEQGYRINVETSRGAKKLPPSIDIVFPFNNLLLTTESEIVIAASGMDSDGTIEKIKFLQNGRLIEEVLVDPIQRGPQSSSISWSPTKEGVYSLSAVAYDNNNEFSISAPVTVVVNQGVASVATNSDFQLFIPGSVPGSNEISLRTSEGEVRAAQAYISAVLVSTAGDLDTLGSIRGDVITDPGTGYVTPPSVRFYGSGSGAKANAVIDTDPNSPLYGSVTSIDYTDRGTGYTPFRPGFMAEPPSKIAFVGGHDVMKVPFRMELPLAEDQYKEVYYLVNGERVDINNDGILNEEDKFTSPPFETSYEFTTGTFDIYAVARDKYNNLSISSSREITILPVEGSRPNAQITYPDVSSNVDAEVEIQEVYESIGSSSEIPFYIEAIDEDGNISELNLYANHTLVGVAEQSGSSSIWKVNLQDLDLKGKYHFNVGSLDDRGNFYRSQSVPVEIVPTFQAPPQVQILTPFSELDKYTIDSNLSFTVQVRELGRPIQSLEFVVNGVVVERLTEPELSIGDFHTYTGNFAPQTKNIYTISAIATDLSGIKAVANYNPEDYGASMHEELITHLPSIDKVLLGERLNGKDYQLIRYVGNKKASEETTLHTSSGFGSNIAPTGSLELPVTGASYRAHEEVSLLANAVDPDGAMHGLSCQFLVNGGNVLIQFKGSGNSNLNEPQQLDGESISIVTDDGLIISYIFTIDSALSGNVVTESGYDHYVPIGDTFEQTARNLHDSIQIDQANDRLDGVYLSFMPDNFYQADFSSSEESVIRSNNLFRTLFLRTDSNKVLVTTSDNEKILTTTIDPISSSETGSFVKKWIPNLGGVYVIQGVIEDAWGGKTMTNQSIVIIEHSNLEDTKYIDADFNGTLEIFPVSAMNGEPIARGSTLSARANFFDNAGLIKDMDSVKFLLNGQTIKTFTGIDLEPPFYADILLATEDPTWLIQVVGVPSVDTSGFTMEPITMQRNGVVAASTQLPTLKLIIPNGIASDAQDNLDGTEVFFANTQISLEALVEGESGILEKVESVSFIINGEVMSGRVEEFDERTPSGLLKSKTYSISVILDANLGTPVYDSSAANSFSAQLYEFNEANITAIALLNNPTATISPENNQQIIILGGANNPASILLDLTGEEISVSQTKNFSASTDNLSEWVAAQSQLSDFSNKIDIVASYNVSIGDYHDSYNSFISDYLQYSVQGTEAGNMITQEVTRNELSSLPPEIAETAVENPNTGAIFVQIENSLHWLKRYIDSLLTSSDYRSKFPPVPDLVGDYGRRFIENYTQNRQNFVGQCLVNKYGYSNFQQRFQGGARIMSFWKVKTPNYWEFTSGGSNIPTSGRVDAVPVPGITSGELALELIFKLSTEEKNFGYDPYILGTRDKRPKEYSAMSYIFSFWKENGIYPYTDNDLSTYANLSTKDMLNEILSDSKYTSRHNRLFGQRKARRVSNADGWKELPWLGYFSDTNFPWVYHVDLGWIYVKGVSLKNFWVFKENLGWLWFSSKAYPHTFSSSENNWVYFDVNKVNGSTNRSKAVNTVYYYSYKFKSWGKL